MVKKLQVLQKLQVLHFIYLYKTSSVVSAYLVWNFIVMKAHA